MHIIKRLVSVARPYAGRLLLVAVLTSLGALGELVEPWVYRAIINDIAGVFVSRASGLWPAIIEELKSGGIEEEPEAAPPAAPSNPTPAPAPQPTPPQSPGSAPPGAAERPAGTSAAGAQAAAAKPARPKSREGSSPQSQAGSEPGGAKLRAKPARKSSRLHRLRRQME